MSSANVPNYLTLSAMITPAIFLTANGSMLISTSNRMSRVVDRIRVLNDLGDKLDRGETNLDYAPDRLAHVHDQLDRLVWRGDRIRYALVALYLAFGAFVGTSLALAIDVWTRNRLPALPTALAVVGVGLLLFACVNLVREALEAMRSNRLEIRFYHDLYTRRKSDGTGRSPIDRLPKKRACPGVARLESAWRGPGPAGPALSEHAIRSAQFHCDMEEGCLSDGCARWATGRRIPVNGWCRSRPPSKDWPRPDRREGSVRASTRLYPESRMRIAIIRAQPRSRIVHSLSVACLPPPLTNAGLPLRAGNRRRARSLVPLQSMLRLRLTSCRIAVRGPLVVLWGDTAVGGPVPASGLSRHDGRCRRVRAPRRRRAAPVRQPVRRDR